MTRAAVGVESVGNPLQVGLLGLGVVGSGLVRVLQENGEIIGNRLGVGLEIRRALVRSLDKPRMVSLPEERLTTNPRDILEDPDIDIIVEVMGGVEPAREYILAALGRGRPVVTANKAVLAQHGPELFRAACEHRAGLYFEASVAAGIPVIRSIVDGLAANQVQTLMGIINGTTNYILTRMVEDGTDFSVALEQAQAAGYAEADPSSDVDGWDAAYKLAILASLAFETYIPVESIHVEGIRRVTPVDIAYSRDLGFTIKLLAVAKNVNGSIEARVHPTLVPQHHPLAAVRDVFNAIFISADAVGELMFYGRGAGSLPTASAVAADLIEAADDLLRGQLPLLVRRNPGEWPVKPVQPITETRTRFYIRLSVCDEPGVLAAMAASFGRNGVSIESVIQKSRGKSPVDVVFVTHDAREADVRQALREIEPLAAVHQVASVIRVEDGTAGDKCESGGSARG
ncbi:MAG: homoserine dehydrogenase [Limnochordales bacterium]|nr:homoserine dehydrogenase [Limnochordales bacterium]